MIANVARINIANGDGANDTFSYTFRILEESDLIVLVKTGSTWALKVLTTDYTVTSVNVASGGTVVFGAGDIPPSGTNNVVIIGSTDFDQLTQLQEGGVGYLNLEQQLDQITMLLQEIRRIFAVPGISGAKLLVGWNENGYTLETKTGATATTPILLTGLPTSDPGVSGQLWNSSGFVKVSP